MANDTELTVVGNAVADAELRFTPAGDAVANFRVASTPRRFDSRSNSWVDGETLFLTVNVWKAQAENVAESVRKGTRVLVKGKLRARSYETREGDKRTVTELEAEEIGLSMLFGPAWGGASGPGGDRSASRPASNAERGTLGGWPNRDDDGVPPWEG